MTTLAPVRPSRLATHILAAALVLLGVAFGIPRDLIELPPTSAPREERHGHRTVSCCVAGDAEARRRRGNRLEVASEEPGTRSAAAVRRQ